MFMKAEMMRSKLGHKGNRLGVLKGCILNEYANLV